MSNYETNENNPYAQGYGQPYGQSGYDDEGTNWTYLIAGALFVAAGAYLVYRAVSSDDELQEYGYNASNKPYGAPASTRKDAEAQREDERGKGIEVHESIVIDKPAAELYSYWRNLENLPQIMSHLESVTETGARSHWKAKAPLGLSAEWDATVTEDRPDELISWRSDKDARVPNEGSVRFGGVGSSSAHNPYTVVTVSLTYHPPFGAVGTALAKLFGEEPSQQVKDDLQNFKQAVESGSLSLGGGLSSGLGSSSF